MFPDEAIPAQRVSVPAVTCPVPQPIPLKDDGSAAHGVISVSLPSTGIECCSSGPAGTSDTRTAHTSQIISEGDWP